MAKVNKVCHNSLMHLGNHGGVDELKSSMFNCAVHEFLPVLHMIINDQLPRRIALCWVRKVTELCLNCSYIQPRSALIKRRQSESLLSNGLLAEAPMR